MKYAPVFILLLAFPGVFLQEEEKKDEGPGMKIIGGSIAHQGQFPYQISLLVNQAFRCGGALIHNQFVLTAAHCLYSHMTFDAYNAEVLVGGTSLRDPLSPTYVVPIVKVYYPSSFLSTANWYITGDIAVLKMKDPLNAPSSWLLGLPHGVSYAGRVGVVTGSGASKKIFTNPHDPSDPGYAQIDGFMRYDEVTVLQNNDCSRGWNYREIPSHLVCVKTGRRVKAALCDGDSGGPLVVDRTVVGVLSVGSAKCVSHVPEIFTRVSSYLAFIHNAMNDEYDPYIEAIDVGPSTVTTDYENNYVPYSSKKSPSTRGPNTSTSPITNSPTTSDANPSTNSPSPSKNKLATSYVRITLGSSEPVHYY